MQNNIPPVRIGTMLQNVNSLPCSQAGSTGKNRDGKLGLREGGADVSRHIVGTFPAMAVEPAVFGGDSPEKLDQVMDDIRIGVFLNE
jgi:hypothetical protein